MGAGRRDRRRPGLADQEEPGVHAAAGAAGRVVPVSHAARRPRTFASGQARAVGRVRARPARGPRRPDHRVHGHRPAPLTAPTRIELFRLVTTLLDHQLAPAAELATLDHQRWESENGYAELKTRLRGAAFILRSRLPELVCQELFAFLTVYQALCALEAEAARQAGIAPDRISFTVTVRIARDHAASHAIITPRSLDLARRQAIGDLISDLLPRRRDRHYERVRKQPKNNFPANETRTGKATQPGHLHNQNQPESILDLHKRLNSPALLWPGRMGLVEGSRPRRAEGTTRRRPACATCRCTVSARTRPGASWWPWPAN